VAKKLLDGADIVALLQQVGGKRVTEGVARRRLGDPGGTDRILHRPLEHGFVEVAAAPLAGHGLYVETRGGEGPLPAPFAAGVRVLALERTGQFDPAGTVAEVGLVLLASAVQVGGQGGLDRGR
jgi:hypothetical protein